VSRDCAQAQKVDGVKGEQKVVFGRKLGWSGRDDDNESTKTKLEGCLE